MEMTNDAARIRAAERNHRTRHARVQAWRSSDRARADGRLRTADRRSPSPSVKRAHPISRRRKRTSSISGERRRRSVGARPPRLKPRARRREAGDQPSKDLLRAPGDAPEQRWREARRCLSEAQRAPFIAAGDRRAARSNRRVLRVQETLPASSAAPRDWLAADGSSLAGGGGGGQRLGGMGRATGGASLGRRGGGLPDANS